MKNYDIKTRPIHKRVCKYKKKNFNGNLEEKSYMIGFRIGDLNVYRVKSTTVARCSTTKQAQVFLIRNLFSSYGGVHITKAKRGTYEVVAYLNSSFNFLIPKTDNIPGWIVKNNRYFLAFFSGYADAEGSLHFHKTYKGKLNLFPIFEISSYDKTILHKIWHHYRKINVKIPKPKISRPKGTPCNDNKYFSNGDCWRLTTGKKDSLWKIIHY